MKPNAIEKATAVWPDGKDGLVAADKFSISEYASKGLVRKIVYFSARTASITDESIIRILAKECLNFCGLCNRAAIPKQRMIPAAT